MPFSAKNLLNDTKLTLEKSATDAFGSAVDDFAKNTLGGLIPSNLPGSTKPVNRNDGSWYASSYAAALAGSTSYRPKLKFLFKVEFIFSEAAMNAYPEVFRDNKRNDFTFMVKSVDRPKFDHEYEDDINMYNFRTKVLKRIRHRDLTMVFMDDVGNRVFDFFRTLMMLHQPITRRQILRDNSMTKPDPSYKTIPHGSGMAFSENDTRTMQDLAHRGVLNGATDVSYGNAIECIRVKQLFVDPAGSIDTATKMVSFDFINPRVVSFDLDEMSHEANDVSLLTMSFDYDWMEMVKIGSLGVGKNIYDLDYDITVPGVNGAPSDITPNHVGTSTGPGSAAGGGNTLSKAISGILGRGASQLTSDAIGKVVKAAGGGRFATALGGAASSALAGPISGIIGGGVRDLLNSPAATSLGDSASGMFDAAKASLSASANSAMASVRGLAQPLIDSSTAGKDKPMAIVSSTDKSS